MKREDSSNRRILDMVIALFVIFIVSSQEKTEFDIVFPDTIPLTNDIRPVNFVNGKTYVYTDNSWEQVDALPRPNIKLPAQYNIKPISSDGAMHTYIFSQTANKIYQEYTEASMANKSVRLKFNKYGGYKIEQI